LGLVTRSLKAPQITRFSTAPDSRPGDQVAEHIGGYLRGHTKSRVTLRDE
jgi:hypothetical protein